MDRNQVQSHSHLDHPFCPENGPSVIPVEYMVYNGGVNSMHWSNFRMRSSEHSSSSMSRDIQYFRVPTSGLQHRPASRPLNSQYHFQSAPSSGGVSPAYVQHGPSRHIIRGVGGAVINSQNEYGRVHSKRKYPDRSVAYDVENVNGYYTRGNSSVLTISSGPQSQRQHPSNITHNYSGNRLEAPREGWQRNVRSRHNNVLHFDRNLSVSHFSSNHPRPPGRFQSTGNIHNQSMTGQWNLGGNHALHNLHRCPGHFCPTGDFHDQNMMGHWSHPFNRRLSASGSGATSHEMNRPLAQPTGGSGLMIDRGHHDNVAASRNRDAHLTAFHVPSARSGNRSSTYSQRTPYRSTTIAMTSTGEDRHLGPDGVQHVNAISSRSWNASLPVFRVPLERIGNSSSMYAQRTVPQRSTSDAVTSSEGVRQLAPGVRQLAPVVFLRSSRPLPNRGLPSSSRSRQLRSSNDRLQPLPASGNGHTRQTREALVATIFQNSRRLADLIEAMRSSIHDMDYEERLASMVIIETASRHLTDTLILMHDIRSSFYNRISSSDLHADMRLDIDSMSYEELLALEERIGNENTGLSNCMIPLCVKKLTYHSSDQVKEEEAEKCVICLEKYEEEDKLGVLYCGHNYHFSCIKQWVQMKTTCPLCKKSVLEK